MATNLLIGYPDIPHRSTQTVSATAATGFEGKYLTTGNRQDIFKLATTQTADLTKSYDLGASVTASANFYAIIRANLLQKNKCTQVVVQGSSASNFVGATTVLTNASFASQTLYGPRQEDYIASFAASTAFRYWRDVLTVSATSIFPHSKTYLGTFFDLGRDPSFPARRLREMAAFNNREPLMQFELEWRDVTDAKVTSLITTIIKHKDVNPVILYDAADVVLKGRTMLHCRIAEFKWTKRCVNSNELYMRFIEAI